MSKPGLRTTLWAAVRDFTPGMAVCLALWAAVISAVAWIVSAVLGGG